MPFSHTRPTPHSTAAPYLLPWPDSLMSVVAHIIHPTPERLGLICGKETALYHGGGEGRQEVSDSPNQDKTVENS